MKTLVEVDSKKIEQIREMNADLETEQEIIDRALDEFLKSMSRQRLIDSFGAGWDGDLDEMRTYDVPLT
ncbi:hypothetical protein [Persicitalea sp.]|uniref:hypothetical protein n=1 Tax=Persicitalea sp. TaxID=3100273 RepID=UPI003593C0D2